MIASHRLAGVLVGILALAAACGGSASDTTTAGTTEAAASATTDGAGIRLVNIDDAKAIADEPPSGLVILDVRTPDEFAEGHLDGAILIDFYADDFAAQVGELDPSVPYLLYCRSGNRSEQAAAVMSDLGFTDVAEVDGGIAAWVDSGFPVAS